MKKIIHHILHRIKEGALPKNAENNKRKVVYKTLPEIRHCLVVWTAQEAQSEWIKKISEEFKGVKIDKLCFVPAEAPVPNLGNLAVMRKEDLGFGGKLQNEEVIRQLEREYDLLIDLSTDTEPLVNYVLTASMAVCKASMKKEGFEADVVIDCCPEPLTFIHQLKELLSQLKQY